MIPVKALINVNATTGPDQLERFNGFLAAKVIGNGAPGISSGQAIANVEDVAQSLPTGYTIAWTGQAFQEKRIGRTGDPRFRLRPGDGVPDSFGQLRALVVAGCGVACGAVRPVRRTCRGRRAEFQQRRVLPDRASRVIGLAAKNAILIIEFAAQEQSRASRRSKPRSKPRGCASGRSS